MFLGFASDNTAGVHPRIMDAIVRANSGYCRPYGLDEYTIQAEAEFRKIFGDDIDVFFALSGTGANVLCLRALVRPWQAVICTDVAHINTEESGAPEFCTGCKLLPVPSVDGKMTPESIDMYLEGIHDCHRSTPAAISITQTTETGSIYQPDEIRKLVIRAHDLGLFVHMDGTRIANAVAALDCDVASFTRDAGVDVMTFGGTKNGFLMAEAVIFFNRKLAADFATMRKQSLQLVSKMRFVAVQFCEGLKDGLWLKNARYANTLAQYFYNELKEINGILVKKPDANAVFVRMSPETIARLSQKYYFYEVDPAVHEIRLMCSFATTKEEINTFVADLTSIVAASC